MLTKHKVVPKTEETIVVMEEYEKTREGEELFVTKIKSPKEEITDERSDRVSIHVTSVTVKRQKEMTMKTESKGRHVREAGIRKSEEKVKERELVKDTTVVMDTDETKPFPVIVSTEAKKLTEKVKIERKALKDKSVHHEFEVISAIPEEKYATPEKIIETKIETKEDPKEITLHGKPTKVIPTPVKIVNEDNREEETQITPSVVIDSIKDESRVPAKKFKKYEVTKKLKSDDIIDAKKEKVAEKPKPEVAVTPKVKPKESATDIELKKPKVIQQEAESEAVTPKTEGVHKKREESKYVPPQRADSENEEETVQTKPSAPSKPAEKERTSPETAFRGTERNSIVMIISILNL